MLDRLYPFSENVFNEKILPLTLEEITPMGDRPPKISHYVCFCAMLKMMLSCSIPWRDCPREYGSWHTIYTRFKRWSKNGLFWKILTTLKQEKCLEFRIVFVAGRGAKIHIIMGKEDVICVDITGARMHDPQPVEEMMSFLNLKENQQPRSRLRGC